MDLLHGATELVDLRTRDAKHYERPDGKRVAVLGQRLHFQATPGGPWLDPEELVVQRSAPGTWTVTTSEISIQANYSAMTLTHLPTNVSWQWVYQGATIGPNGEVVYNGVPWQYTPSPWGVKSDAVVKTRRGPQTYDWIYLSNAQNIRVDDAGNIRSDTFLIQRPFVIGANGERYETSAWDLSVPSHARFSFDDSDLPEAAFPYVIDPSTTFETAVGTDDLELSARSATWPPTVADLDPIDRHRFHNRARNNWEPDGYKFSLFFVRFDTSDIPEHALITDATLWLHIFDRVGGGNGFRFVGEYYDGANWPIDASDYSTTWVETAFATGPISAIVDGTNLALPLKNPDANINRSGYTGFRAWVDGGVPTGINEMNIASYENPYTGQPSPYLVVEYQDAAPPPQTIGPIGIPTQESVPNPTLLLGTVTLNALGIPSQEQVSAPSVLPGTVTLVPLGIATQEAFGTPTITQPQLVYPTSILSGEAFGVPDLTTILEVRPVGIPSGEAIPAPVLYPGEVFILPVSIPGGEAFGIPELVEPNVVRVVGIPSAEAFGSPTITTQLVVQVEGIVSREAFGRALVRPLRYALPPEASLVLNVPYQGGLQIESPYRASLQLENRVTGDLILVRKR